MRIQRLLFAFALLASTVVFGHAMGGADPVPRCGTGETAGAIGAGDAYFPTYGNGGYDVQHYDLAIRFAPARDFLNGKATIDATATQNLTCFSLDLVGLKVNAIAVNGQAATWSRTGQELMIVPAGSLDAGAAFTLVVRYEGVPRSYRLPGLGLAGFIHTEDGAIVAGEPESAASWFPVNDHPVDRAAYTFRITVPSGYRVIANGVRESRTTSGRWTTHVWQAHDPMVSYLATIGIGEWRMRFSETASGLPVIDAVDPDLHGAADATLARQPKILSFLESVFGPYPFESVGAIVPDTGKLGFALETQTRPIYARYFFPHGTSVVVHELAHQWFGDLVAVDRWQHIWLNEGFATYAEWLWFEHKGVVTAQKQLKALFKHIPRNSPFWWIVVGDPGADELFNGAVYLRGAMTLQALRNEVGDGTFFTILSSWIQTNEGGTGTTEEFIEIAEQESGLELDELFDIWLFTPRKPQASAITASGQVSVSPKVAERVASWLRGFDARHEP